MSKVMSFVSTQFVREYSDGSESASQSLKIHLIWSWAPFLSLFLFDHSKKSPLVQEAQYNSFYGNAAKTKRNSHFLGKFRDSKRIPSSFHIPTWLECEETFHLF